MGGSSQRSRDWVHAHQLLYVRPRRLLSADRTPLLDAQGEEEWLPVLGCTAITAARYLIRHTADGGTNYDLSLLSRSLGLPTSTAKWSPIVRAIGRLIDFGVLVIDSTAVRDVLIVNRDMPQPPQRLLDRARETNEREGASFGRRQ